MLTVKDVQLVPNWRMLLNDTKAIGEYQKLVSVLQSNFLNKQFVESLTVNFPFFVSCPKLLLIFFLLFLMKKH